MELPIESPGSWEGMAKEVFEDGLGALELRTQVLGCNGFTRYREGC